MGEDYKCTFNIEPPFDEVDIECKGEGQELHFTLAIGFVSVPSLLYRLTRLWKGKTKESEMDGFGNAVDYYFKKEEDRLLIEHVKFNDSGKEKHYYDFDFERFVKSVDQGLTNFIEKQRELGEYPLKENYSPHLFESENMEEYAAFLALINGKTTNL